MDLTVKNIEELGWRSILKYNLEDNGLTDVYEFGVFTGKSMAAIASIYRKKNIPIRKFFGLDSFEGLPNEEVEPAWQDCWKEGEFDGRAHFNVDTVEDCVLSTERFVGNYLNSETKLELIAGFYDNVLDSSSVATYDMKPAHYIDVDVDIYSSAKFVLDYCFDNGLAVPGTVIGYDDWGGSPGWATFENGESRAHKEAEEKYNVEFVCLGQYGLSYPHIARVYKVVSIGN